MPGSNKRQEIWFSTHGELWNPIQCSAETQELPLDEAGIEIVAEIQVIGSDDRNGMVKWFYNQNIPLYISLQTD